MAKTQVNKTQLIKDALAKNPKASPSEIAEGLKKHGISAQYVSTVKSSLKAKKYAPISQLVFSWTVRWCIC